MNLGGGARCVAFCVRRNVESIHDPKQGEIRNQNKKNFGEAKRTKERRGALFNKVCWLENKNLSMAMASSTSMKVLSNALGKR